MRSEIFADLKYYNANSRNNNVGDCTKRALSFAYSMNYDDVSKELNRIKRELNLPKYNRDSVWRKFVEDRGDEIEPVDDVDITVSEFAEQNPTGSYVLAVGKDTSSNESHLVAIVNGDIYDTWNSQNWYVKQVVRLTNAKTEVYSDNIEDIAKPLSQFASDYIEKLDDTIPECMSIRAGSSYFILDDNTMQLDIICKIDPCPVSSKYYKYGREDAKLRHEITIKMNPRLTLDENYDKLSAKLKQQIYSWVYNTKKEVTSAIEVETFCAVNNRSVDDLRKLPSWVWPKVINSSFSKEWKDYYLVIEADQNDPRGDDYPEVSFQAETLKELLEQLDMYKNGYYRLNYDY
jgi:hypothetical protein